MKIDKDTLTPGEKALKEMNETANKNDNDNMQDANTSISEEDNIDISETSDENKVSFVETYLDEVDHDHEKILEALAISCYSNKTGFTNTDRIEKIRELLADSGYKELYINTASIWHKGNLIELKDSDVVLVSSHADLVSQITSPHSKLTEDGYYKGTYDNIGTNAAAVITMREGNLPNNVIFTFTSEEETGRFLGAKDSYDLLKSAGINEDKIVCMTLDVTDEGYDEGVLSSVENMPKNKDFLNKITNCMMKFEPEGRQSFCFVKKSKKAIPDKLDSKYIQPSTGLPDEAFYYGKLTDKTLSLCLPTEGWMHSNVGLTTRQPVFEGYVNTIKGLIYTLTNTNEHLLTSIQIEQNTLLDRVAVLVKEEEIKKASKPKTDYSYRANIGNSYEQMMFGTSYYDDYAIPNLIDIDNIEEIDNILCDNMEGYIGGFGEAFVSDMMSMIAPDVFDMIEDTKTVALKYGVKDSKLDKFLEDVFTSMQQDDVYSKYQKVAEYVSEFYETNDGMWYDTEDYEDGYTDIGDFE